MRSLLFILLASLLDSAHAQYASIDLPLGPRSSSATLHYFIFSSSTHTLKVIDQGKEKRFADLDAAMRANGCIAGCNGGFFHPNGTPLGLVIANGRMTGNTKNTSSLTSATLYVENDMIRLIRSRTFASKSAPLPRNVIQTGPYLIESGKRTTGLSNKNSARRTFIANDGRSRWLIGHTPPTTLSQLANILAKPDAIPGFRIRFAANLDGGSSSALWVRRPQAPLYFRELRQIQNFIGIVPK